MSESKAMFPTGSGRHMMRAMAMVTTALLEDSSRAVAASALST